MIPFLSDIFVTSSGLQPHEKRFQTAFGRIAVSIMDTAIFLFGDFEKNFKYGRSKIDAAGG